jgi:hypothetical protein
LLNLDPERFNFTERRLVVTFEDTAAKALRVREWTGLSWTDLGDPLEPWSLSQTAPEGADFFGQDVPAHDAALDFDNGIVVVFRAPVTVEGRTEFHLFASRYSRFTGEWTAVGDPAAEPAGLSRHPHDINAAGHVAPRIAIGLDHRPMVAWAFRPATNREHLLVRRLREPLPRIINPDLDQTLAPILGLVDPSPQNETRIDDENDGVVDIADVRRLLFIP